MRLIPILAAAFGAALLAGCGQTAAPPQTEPGAQAAPVAEEPGETPVAEEAAAPAPALPCGIIAQRDWEAALNPGGPPTLTVSGVIDLPTPGYSVSLAAEATLSLRVAPPSGSVAQVVTAHPVYYFGPASGQYSIVHVTCDGAALTDIAVSGAQ